MTQIIVDAQLARQLQGESSEVELCSPDGEVLGMFHASAVLKSDRKSECPVSSDELRRRNRAKGGRTLDDIIADLEQNG